MVGFVGLSNYYDVRDLGSIYDSIPNGHALLAGFRTIGLAGVITFAWNFFQFAASPFCKGALLGTVGLVDLGLALALISGVVSQARFLPGTYGGCHDAANWRNGTDGRNFFLVANATNQFHDDGGPDKICHSFVETWIFAIVVIIFYLICSFVNLALGFGDTLSGNRGSHRSFGTPPQYDCDFWFSDCFPVGWIGILVFFVMDHPIAVCRFASRYVRKAVAGSRMRSGRDGRKTETRPQVESEKTAVTVDPPPILPRDVLIMIATKVDMADLVSLSKSSKRLRTIFFGAEYPPDVLDQLRQYACDGNNKLECDICLTQICANCSRLVPVPEIQASLHTTQCQPYCSGCYYTDYCRLDSSAWRHQAKHTHYCPLNEKKKRKNDVEMATGGRLANNAEKRVCRSCAALAPAEAKKLLEARGQREVQRLGLLPLSCAKCQNLLPDSGPRWWSCVQCHRECPSGLHAPWAAGK